jgi:hypothetical protein
MTFNLDTVRAQFPALSIIIGESPRVPTVSFTVA